MDVISELKKQTGFDESGDPSVSVPKRMNRNQEKMGKQSSNDWMSLFKPARINETNIFLH